MIQLIQQGALQICISKFLIRTSVIIIIRREKITITISTHPRRELDERGIIRNTFIYANVLQSGVNTAQEFRNAFPDCLMEVAHSCSHLVLWGRRTPSDLVSTKSSLYLDEKERYIYQLAQMFSKNNVVYKSINKILI